MSTIIVTHGAGFIGGNFIHYYMKVHPLDRVLTSFFVTTADNGVSVPARPFNSRLDKSKLMVNGFAPLPTWQDAVSRYLKEAQL